MSFETKQFKSKATRMIEDIADDDILSIFDKLNVIGLSYAEVTKLVNKRIALEKKQTLYKRESK